MRFENSRFTTDVTLDYNQFINCRIENCVVLFHGGDFSLVGTTLTNVRFGLGGPANSTLAFLRLVRAASPNALQELLDGGPQPAPGQVTIN